MDEVVVMAYCRHWQLALTLGDDGGEWTRSLAVALAQGPVWCVSMTMKGRRPFNAEIEDLHDVGVLEARGPDFGEKISQVILKPMCSTLDGNGASVCDRCAQPSRLAEAANSNGRTRR